MPTLTNKVLIPDPLLKSISCSCGTGCNSKKCSCRKHGLRCTNLCSNCHGSETCSNVEKVIYEEVSDSENAIDDQSINPRQNTADDVDDSDHEDIEDTTDSESITESDIEEQSSLSKRPRLIND